MAVDMNKLGELIDDYGGIAADDLNALPEVRDTSDEEITRLRAENARLRTALAIVALIPGLSDAISVPETNRKQG